MKPKCSPFTLPRDVWVIISADPLAMTLRCQTASFEHNLSNHKNTQVIGLSVSYVAFTLRTAMLFVDARIGIEPILQVPKTWVISHYTIEQTLELQIYYSFLLFASVSFNFSIASLVSLLSLIIFNIVS